MDERRAAFLQESYAQCFQEKRHYDLLSWSIGGAVILADTLLISALLRLPVQPDRFNEPKVLIAIVVLALSALWSSIYERNRFWGEVCNEKARDLEKAFAADGLGHAYMRGGIRRRVVLKNLEFDGSRVTKADGGEAGERVERDWSSGSMHVPVRAVIWSPFAIAITLAVLQISTPA